MRKEVKGEKMRKEVNFNTIFWIWFVWIVALVLVTVCSIAIAENIYGGDTITYNIPKCEWLVANITNANLTEWNVIPNCIEQSAGNFFCNCTDNETLSLTSKPNSVGNFGISIIYHWTEQSSTGNVGGGSYTGSFYFPYTSSSSGKNITINVTQTIEKETEIIVNQTANETSENETSENETSENEECKNEECKYDILFYILIFIFVLSLISLLFILNKITKNKKVMEVK